MLALTDAGNVTPLTAAVIALIIAVATALRSKWSLNGKADVSQVTSLTARIVECERDRTELRSALAALQSKYEDVLKQIAFGKNNHAGRN